MKNQTTAVKVKQSQTKKRRTRDELQAAIIAAATELFARQGYTGPSIRDIAEHADVALPALYRFFVNKHDLYVQCCKMSVKQEAIILNELSAFQENKDKSLESILFITTRALIERQSSVSEPPMMSRTLFDGDANLIKSEVEEVFQSDFFKKTVEAAEKIAGKKCGLKRLVYVHSLAFSYQPIFSFWDIYYPVKSAEDTSTSKTVEILDLTFPEVDWEKVALQSV